LTKIESQNERKISRIPSQTEARYLDDDALYDQIEDSSNPVSQKFQASNQSIKNVSKNSPTFVERKQNYWHNTAPNKIDSDAVIVTTPSGDRFLAKKVAYKSRHVEPKLTSWGNQNSLAKIETQSAEEISPLKTGADHFEFDNHVYSLREQTSVSASLNLAPQQPIENPKTSYQPKNHSQPATVPQKPIGSTPKISKNEAGFRHYADMI
jgi:hypothetical protein